MKVDGNVYFAKKININNNFQYVVKEGKVIGRIDDLWQYIIKYDIDKTISIFAKDIFNSKNECEDFCAFSNRMLKIREERKKHKKLYEKGSKKEMKVETKYNIGDEVYLAYEDKNSVVVIKDKISSIIVDKDNKINYFFENQCDEFKEEEMISVKEEQLLLKQIKDILNKEGK